MAKPRKARRPAAARAPAEPAAAPETPRARAVRTARRVFVGGWILLGLLGALNHTVLGHSLDLALPHLRYGHVMFNKNPHQVPVFEYAGRDGVRHNIAELVRTPAPGYLRTRTAMDVVLTPDYLAEICIRAIAKPGDELTFYVDDYDVDADPAHPSKTTTLTCGWNGLTPR